MDCDGVLGWRLMSRSSKPIGTSVLEVAADMFS